MEATPNYVRQRIAARSKVSVLKKLAKERWAKLHAASSIGERKADAYFQQFDRYHDDPIGFFRDVLKTEPWEHGGNGFAPHGQTDIILAVRDNDTTACRSGHKTGKSTSAAGLALWFLCTRDEARVICTAPTDRQIRKVIWREIRRLVKRSGLKLHVPKDPGTGIQTDDDRELFGFSASDPDAFSGVSGANVFYIADEASGIAEEIFEALEGNRAGGAKLYMPGNPTQVSGTFFEAFHRRGLKIKTLHIDSRDAAKYGSHIPGIATAEWCEDKAIKWGIGSPRHDVRCAGNFPSESNNNVIPLALVEVAKARYADIEPSGALALGIDVAREGDDETIIQPMRGRKAYPSTSLKGAPDGHRIADEAMRIARDLRTTADGGKPIRVNIDIIGVGAAPFDVMRGSKYSRDLSPCAVNAGHAAENEDNYFNLRSELHFALRQWLEEGGAIPDDEQLESDLLAATFSFDPRGRYKVESKADIKKRLGRSPDRSDALQLAAYRADYSVPDIGHALPPMSRWHNMPGRGF